MSAPDLAAPTLRPTLGDSARRIAPLAWPVFVGQVAVLAFSTIDTLMAARSGPSDLAALAVGGAAYITIFVGLMGVVMAVGPIAGQLFGAGKLHESGRQLQQAMWLALALSVPGCLLLLFPEPFLWLAQVRPDVVPKVRGYLAALAVALPFALLFTAFRGFNNAVSRPRVVMMLQLGALGLKVPLTAAFVFGWQAPGGGFELPALGAPGCGVATALCMALQMALAWVVLQRDPFYRRFGLSSHLGTPHRGSLVGLVRLGVPMGASIAIEVTGFTFMAFLISRIGPLPVAGHQVAVNVVSLMFMVPLALSNAAATLVAQRIGADDLADARRIGWHGVELGVVIAALMGLGVFALRESIVGLYTRDAVVVAAALPLLAWVVLFHIADAAQTLAAFVLRAWRIAVAPLVIYALAIWGVGLGGGYVLAFNTTGLTPVALQGAAGLWSAATVGLTFAALGMCAFLNAMLRRQRRAAASG